MPKIGKKKGGKGGKKVGNKKVGGVYDRPLIRAENMEDYGKVMKCLGDRKVSVLLSEGITLCGLIAGRFRKRVWIQPGDIVLVSKRGYQEHKVDIINKYFPDEIKRLHKEGFIPDFFLDADATEDVEDMDIKFNEDSEDNEDNKDNEFVGFDLEDI